MMSSTGPDPNKLLQEALQAMRRGDRTRARDLLLEVVEQNDKIEQVWLWLSEVVDDPQDQVTALENALSLNPANTAAQQRLASLQPAPAAPPADIDRWRDLLPESRQEDVSDGIDEPLQCVYCGRLTAEKDRRCPHCGRNLIERVQESDTSEFLRQAMRLLVVYAVFGMLDLAGPFFAFNAAAGTANQWGMELLLSYGGWFLGNFLNIPAQMVGLLIIGYVLRAVLYFVLLFLMSQRFSVAYYGTLGALLADLLFNIWLGVAGYLGLAAVGVNGLFILSVLGLLFASDREFAVVQQRLMTRADGEARSALDFYKRGHSYRKRGMWALAVAQWREAVGLAPREVQYYKDLGVGYAQLHRYERSLRMLTEARRQAPQDPDLPRMIALVEKQAAQQK
jgi:tetratricopeptide (TPR) repeat protein